MKNCWEGCFRRSKSQNFLCLPTVVANRIFRHIPTDRQEFEMIAEKWNYLITMTAGIQNFIFSTGALSWIQDPLLNFFRFWPFCVVITSLTHMLANSFLALTMYMCTSIILFFCAFIVLNNNHFGHIQIYFNTI